MTSDLSKLELLSVTHELSSIEVCTDRAVTRVVGMQLSYGQFTLEGEVTNAIPLNVFGKVDESIQVCTNFYIPQGDYLAVIIVRYNTDGITQI